MKQMESNEYFLWLTIIIVRTLSLTLDHFKASVLQLL